MYRRACVGKGEGYSAKEKKGRVVTVRRIKSIAVINNNNKHIGSIDRPCES
jgi:hypothetical protein